MMVMRGEELKRRLDAMINSLSDERLRWLIGKGRLLIEKGEMKLEEYERLMEEIMQSEMERRMIINELKSGSLKVSEIASRLNLQPKKVFRHLMTLRRKNIVAVAGEREGELEFRLL